MRFLLYALGFAAVAVVDWVTPLGLADWLIPMSLVCFAAAHATVLETIAVATAATVCTAAGLWSSPADGMPFWVAAVNRAGGTAIVWGSVYVARRRRIAESEARVLRGLLPICSACKRIRYGDDQWQPVESYISGHSNAVFTHTLCPTCFDQYRVS